MRAPSGAQHELRSGPLRAVVVEVGGGLRSLTADGRPLVHGYGPEEDCPGAAGAILAPWPGRVEDGRYAFGGVRHQLPVTEPDRGTALHGLVHTRPWHRREGSRRHVVLGLELQPSAGYPFPLSLSVRWELGLHGLTATHTATNTGPAPCPFGLGAHPYLGGFAGDVEGLVVTLPAGLVEPLDARGLPGAPAPVRQAGLDFRAGARIGARAIDHTFSALLPGPDGRVEVTVIEADGRGAVLWLRPPFRHVHLFSSDSLGGARHRRALAIEPLTCPANAFRSGRDLITLAPGATVEASWGIEAR